MKTTINERVRHLVPLVFLLAIMVVIVGCGNGLDTPEEALTDRAQAHANAWTTRQWDQLYQFVSPRWGILCSRDDYEAYMMWGLGIVEEFYGVEEGEQLEIEVVRVNVSGDEALVHAELIVRGERTGVDEAGDRWVFDRQWWMEPKIWDRGCEFSKDS